MKPEALALARRMHRNEATDQRIYTCIAQHTRNDHNRDVLERIAQDEARHCAAWGERLGEASRVNGVRVWWFCLLSRIFGLVFVISLLESGEDDAADVYRALGNEWPEAVLMLEDETRHEAELAALIKEERLSYISSMILGLNDALVELTGALAGFTLALNDNGMIGMAGFITGVAATLSMAASEYLSKKADPHEPHPLKAATYTGVAYLFTVILLLFPYMVVSSPLLALGWCLFNASCIIVLFTFFVSVVQRSSFRRGFQEMMLISFSVATISFVIGWGARLWLHLDV